MAEPPNNMIQSRTEDAATPVGKNKDRSDGPSVIRTIIELSIRYLDATFLLLYYFPYSTGSWSAWYRRLGLAVSKAAEAFSAGWRRPQDDARPPSTPPPLPPDVYGAISQYLGASSSRAALLAVCTAARDGVLSSCHSIQVTLSEDVGVLPKRVSLLQRARSKGLIKEAALNNVTLRLKGVHSWSDQASQEVVAALPHISTLVLRDCVIPAARLAPLLKDAQVKCVELEGNSDLSGYEGSGGVGQGLLDLLSCSPTLTGVQLNNVTRPFRPAAPTAVAAAPAAPEEAAGGGDGDGGHHGEAEEGGQQQEQQEEEVGAEGPPGGEAGAAAQPAPVLADAEALAPAAAPAAAGQAQAAAAAQLPALSGTLKRVCLMYSGSLSEWAPVLTRLPALEHLTATLMSRGGTPEDVPSLAAMLLGFTCLKTLHLPGAVIASPGGGGQPLRALLQMPALEDLQVGGLGYHSHEISQDSLPSSVHWRTFRAQELRSSAVRLLPPSALAALEGPYTVFMQILPTPATVAVVWQCWQAVHQLVAAQEARKERQQPNLLDQCTLRVTVGPGEEQHVRQAWATLLFCLLPCFSQQLQLHNLQLVDFKAADLGPALGSALTEMAGEYIQWDMDAEPHYFRWAEQQDWDSMVAGLLQETFPALRTLELEGCDICSCQLAPLLSSAPVSTLKLTGGTQLGGSSDPSKALQGLLSLLSECSSIHHLEVDDSLWGAAGPQHSHLRALSKHPQLHHIKHVSLRSCGTLHSLEPLLALMPSLTHLEVSDKGPVASHPIEGPLSRVLPGMPHLKTLLLPDTMYHGILPPAVLESTSMERLQLRGLMPPESAWHVFQLLRSCWLLGTTRVADRMGLKAMTAMVNTVMFMCLPNKLARVLEGPISVFVPWRSISTCNPVSTLVKGAFGFRETRQGLEACQQLSNCELHICLFPERAAGVKGAAAEDMINLMEGGVTAVTMEWHTAALMSGAHLAAVGTLLGPYITHLTLMTSQAIPDDVWSGLWAAFPRLQHLSLRARNIGSSTAVCAFCAAAPHPLEVLVLPGVGLTAESWIDADLHSTRVLIRTMS